MTLPCASPDCGQVNRPFSRAQHPRATQRGKIMSKSASIRVFSVDDHQLIRKGIVMVNNDQPDMQVVGEASNGREAIQGFREHQPDVTLMDLRLPDMSGIDAMIAIRTEAPE